MLHRREEGTKKSKGGEGGREEIGNRRGGGEGRGEHVSMNCLYRKKKNPSKISYLIAHHPTPHRSHIIIHYSSSREVIPPPS
jgi:hypothetical protein